MKSVLLATCAALLLSAATASAQQNRGRDDDDDPAEYRDRQEAREAYRRGYERGFERGYRKGLDQGERRAPIAAPPPPPPPPVPVLGPIRVTSAFYGTSGKSCDATRHVGRQANGKRSHSLKVTNEMCGDPSRGDRKTLEVTFWCGQVSRTASAREHQTIFLNCN